MTNEHAETVFAAWAVRVEAGEDLPFADLLSANTDCAEELLKLHDDWKLFAPLLGRVVPGLIASSEGMSLPPLSVGDEDAPEMPSNELLDRLGIHAPNSGRYRFRSVIGRGGGGIVLKVWDTKLNRPLAMKVVLGRGEGRPTGETPRVDGRTLSRFVDEARIASQLNHPGIVPVHELGADESGRAFFTMKLVRGEDLSKVFEHVKTGKDGWNQTRALSHILRACEAMAFAHDKGVVHRDLKPANIMVGRYGEVYVMDWGLARVLGEKDHRDIRVKPHQHPSVVDSLRATDRDQGDSPLLTMDGIAIGTPAYMSPEQAEGNVEAVDVRSDVYAVGAMIYELVAGQMPYVAPGTQVGPYTLVRRVTEGPPKPLAELAPRAPAELIAIAEKAMNRDPAQRYADTEGLANDLRAFLEQRVVGAYETGTWAETRKWVQRNRALSTAIAVGSALTLLSSIGLAVALNIAQQRQAASTLNEQIAKAQTRAAQKSEARATSNLYVASIRAADACMVDGVAREAGLHLAKCPEQYRGWEWNYLSLAGNTSAQALTFPDGADIDGNAVAYDPLGRYLAIGTEHGVGIWDSDGSCLIRTLPCAALPDSQTVTFSNDGSILASTDREGLVTIWNAESLDLSRVVYLSEPANSVALSNDGSYMVAQSIYSPFFTSIEVVNTRTHDRAYYDTEPCGNSDSKFLLSRDGRTGYFALGSAVVSVSLSGDLIMNLITDFSEGDVSLLHISQQGNTIALKAGDVVAMLDLATAAVTGIYSGGLWHESALSPDGTLLALASSDNTIHVWDTLFGLSLGTFPILERALPQRLAFSADGNSVALSAPGLVFNAYSSRTATLLRTLPPNAGRWGQDAPIAMSPDGGTIATGVGSQIVVWNAYTGEPITILESGNYGSVGHLTYGLTRNQLLSYSGAKDRLLVWDVYRNSVSHSLPWYPYSSEDSLVRFGGNAYHGPQVLDLTSLTMLAPFDESESFERPITASDSHLVEVGGVLTMVDPTATHVIAKQAAHTECSPDGSSAITFLKDGAWGIFSIPSGELRGIIAESEDCRFSFSPDGSRLVSCSRFSSPRLWSAESGELLLTIRIDSLNGSSAPLFSPDGSRIAFCGSTGTWICETDAVTCTDVARQLAFKRQHEIVIYLYGLYKKLGSWTLVRDALSMSSTLLPDAHEIAARLATIWAINK